MNDFIIKTNNGRTIYLFENEGLCIRELTGYSNRYKLIYSELKGDFSVADTGYGELGIVCQNKAGSIVFIKENNGEFVKTVLLNSKSRLIYDKKFVLLLHGRWIGISYIIEYQGKNLLSFQLVDNENEPPLAVDYISDKKYFTYVDEDYNRIFIYNRNNEIGYKVYRWSLKAFNEYEKLCEGEFISAVNGFSSDCYIVFKKEEKNYLLTLKRQGLNLIKEIYPIDFLDKYDDLSLLIDKNILWIIVIKKDFTFAYKTDINLIAFSSQYNIFTDGKVRKIKTSLNDTDKRAIECFGTIKELTPDLILYKDLKKTHSLVKEREESNAEKEKLELKRKLDKIEIRLKLLEEKEKVKNNFENSSKE